MNDIDTETRPVPTIGQWRKANRVRAGYQVLNAVAYDKDGTEEWWTVTKAMHFTSPIKVSYLAFDNGKNGGLPASDGVFDYPTRSWTGEHPVGAEDTVERYVLEHQTGDRWVFVHTGTFKQPTEETAFYITLVGGPEDGQREYVLGGARQWEGGPIPLFPGRVLRHVGDDPAKGRKAHDPAKTIGPENWAALEEVIREVAKRVGPRVLEWRVVWGIDPLIGLIVMHTAIVTARDMRLGKLVEELKAAEADRETLTRVREVLARLEAKDRDQSSAMREGAFDEAALMLWRALEGASA